MAKTISVLKNPGKMALSSGLSANEYKEIIQKLEAASPQDIIIASIEIRAPFAEAFTAKDATYTAIVQSIKKHGFDRRFPVLIWQQGPLMTLIDGHRRVSASKENNLDAVPAIVIRDFKTDKEAMDYLLRIQFDRRNLDSVGILQFILKHGMEYLESGSQDKGRIREKLAGLCHISSAKAGRILAVKKNASEEQIERIISGESSLMSVYDELFPKNQKESGTVKSTGTEHGPKETANNMTDNTNGDVAGPSEIEIIQESKTSRKTPGLSSTSPEDISKPSVDKTTPAQLALKKFKKEATKLIVPEKIESFNEIFNECINVLLHEKRLYKYELTHIN